MATANPWRSSSDTRAVDLLLKEQHDITEYRDLMLEFEHNNVIQLYTDAGLVPTISPELTRTGRVILTVSGAVYSDGSRASRDITILTDRYWLDKYYAKVQDQDRNEAIW